MDTQDSISQLTVPAKMLLLSYHCWDVYTWRTLFVDLKLKFEAHNSVFFTGEIHFGEGKEDCVIRGAGAYGLWPFV